MYVGEREMERECFYISLYVYKSTVSYEITGTLAAIDKLRNEFFFAIFGHFRVIHLKLVQLE